jgi:hypothetical protein
MNHPAANRPDVSHPDIDAHLATLADRLPADLVDELADGLTQTYRHHLARTGAPDAAAAAALAEFGDPATLLRVCLDASPGRRTARALLLTGPALGGIWALAFITSHAWTWPVPDAAKAAFALTLAAAIATLAGAVRAHTYRHARLLATAGLGGAAAVDLAILTAVAATAPTFTWPITIAAGASLTRLGLTATRLATLRA